MSGFDKHRKRRVIYNDDNDQQYADWEGYHYNITDEPSFLDARTTPTFDTHVDTYVWCVGNGCEPPWGAWGGSVWPCLGSETHATNLIVDACHAKGIEVWGSLRINDLHDNFNAANLEGTNDPLKAAHPEYLIGNLADRELPPELKERYLWTAFNFEREEVRNYRLDYIARNAAAHDFDGYEIDFTRWIWNFPLGRERERAPLMTDFVRRARAQIDSIGKKRGRPYTFVVHVLDSLETSLDLGLDVATWVAEGLIDVLVVGLGYMPYTLPMDEWKALGERYGVSVYPSINTNVFNAIYRKRFQRVDAWHEAIRATASWWWACGADGLYLFNLYCQEQGDDPMDKDLTHAPLKEIGDPAALAGKDKLYWIQPNSSRGFCVHGSEAAALPVPLDTHERKLPLKIGDDADDPKARFTMYFWTVGGRPTTKVWMRVNHFPLEPLRRNDHYVLRIPAGVIRKGANEVCVWRNEDFIETGNSLIVQEVFVAATYED